VRFELVKNNDFTEVTSSRCDAVLVFPAEGWVSGHRTPPPAIGETMLQPLRLVPATQWASEASTAVALNRRGEILVFHDKELPLACKRRRWRYFAPEAIVTPLAGKAPVTVTIAEVREAVYGASLEASRTGTGDGVGLLDGYAESMDAGVILEGYVPASCAREKVARLRGILGDKPSFQDLDSASRQEIAALQGATVLTLDVERLAARAILLIRKSRSGTNRRRAAEAFRDSNICIKIANDGYLQVFADEDEEPFVSFG